MKTWERYKKCDDFRVGISTSVADECQIKSIAENGIFEVGKGGIYTKVYKFSDINFVTASVDEQTAILESWCKWLNSNNTPFKITFNNKNKNMSAMRNDVLIAACRDDYDVYRDMFNEIVEKQIDGRNRVEQEMYITVRYDNADSYETAVSHFDTLEKSMARCFHDFGSILEPLNATERLRILHDFYRFGKEEYFEFDFRQSYLAGRDFKEAIMNSRIRYHEKYFETDEKFCTCLYLKQLPTSLSTDFMHTITSLPIKMMCTYDIAPISDTDVDAKLKELYLGIQDRIRKQTRTHVKQMDFNSEVSLAVQMEQDDVERMIKDKRDNGQRFFYSMFNIVVIADTKEQMERDAELLIKTAADNSVVLAYCYDKQREALNTILPVGTRHVENGCNLQTRSMPCLFPFNVQELFMHGGNWNGVNCESGNINLVNRKSLLNPHGFYFGVTGSGKTTACELEVMQTFLKTGDDIIIVDPKNDYEHLCSLLDGSYLDISTVSTARFNPLAFFDEEGVRSNIADEKSELVLSVVETCKREPLSAKERSIVVRVLKGVYSTAYIRKQFPTFTDIYNSLDEAPEPEAHDIKLYLEMFVTGSMNIFSEQSNVDMYSNRLTVFGLQKMGKELRDLSMLVMLECIKERIMWNAKHNKGTWLFIDEFHEVLHTEYSTSYIKSLWMLVRSLGGVCTGLTQNVTDVLRDDTTKAMLDNSEYVVILKQQSDSVNELINNVGLSPELAKYCTTHASFGKGIVRAGLVRVPVTLEIDRDLCLYDLLVRKIPVQDIIAR